MTDPENQLQGSPAKHGGFHHDKGCSNAFGDNPMRVLVPLLEFNRAGQGEKYSNALKNLKPGDLVFAYMSQLGYVGFGKVTQPAMMVRDFIPDGEKKKLLELPLQQPNMNENKNDPSLSECVVGVKWEKTFSRQQAKTFPGIFANQNIVCKLRDPPTVDYLRKAFGIT